jgi:hypothetical protein
MTLMTFGDLSEIKRDNVINW